MSNIFTRTGENHHDLWLVNGSPDFSIFPGGIVDGIDSDIPIHLKVGNLSYGEKHIHHRHANWVKKQNFNSVAELVHFKLSQPGEIYCAGAENKIKIIIRLKPPALMIMEISPRRATPHFSVTTLYHHQGVLDGIKLGRYPGRR